MKKLILALSLSLIIMAGSLVPVIAQEQPAPQKDTVNMDTNAKPNFYYSVEDENAKTGKGKSKIGIFAIIGGAVIVAVGAGLILRKKK